MDGLVLLILAALFVISVLLLAGIERLMEK